MRCNKRGGIEVDDNLETSEKGIFAIGECASWRGNTYGLIAPGVEMADILAFNLVSGALVGSSLGPATSSDYVPDLHRRKPNITPRAR